MKNKWRKLGPELTSDILFAIVRTVCSTMRFRMVNYPADDHNLIFCGWHGRSFTFANQFRRRKWWVIISHSNDGEIQSRIFSKLGYRVIRGSTGRGGVRAAVEAIRALKEGGTMAMTPDGPRGPSGVVQGGVMLMALKSGAGLVPVGIASHPHFSAKSWDRYMIPMPFSKCIMIFGDPIYVPPGSTEEQVEEVRLKLEHEIHRLERETEDRLGIRTQLVRS
ncbi:MAG: lysophospholipid acyltransferase family protein [Fimbriimonas sp.]|nr:lysophospholipid acyltransferase family protein [Fimbriimonas sp.]